MKPIRHRTRRAGYAMITWMATLMVLGVFALVASRMFISVLRVTRSTSDSENRSARVDHMIRMLRADVWGATDARLAEKKLLIRQAGGSTLTWSIGDDHTIVRTDEASKQTNRWAQTMVSFDGRGDSVLVTIEDGPFQSKRQLLLVSQVQLAGREGK